MGGKGGGSAYVRAHARAARRAGFEPHVFCLSSSSGVSAAPWGVVHRVAAPWFLARGARNVSSAWSGAGLVREWWYANALSAYGVMVLGHRLAGAVAEFVAGLGPLGPRLLHGFYTWGIVGLEVRRRLRRRQSQVELRVLTSAYTLASREAAAKARTARDLGGTRASLLALAERVWISAVVSPAERRAYRWSDRVLVNYESVRAQLRAVHGEGAPVVRLPYASERAFEEGGNGGPDRRHIGLPRRLLSLSRHDPRKGVDVLLRALALLGERGVPFRACVVSGGPLLGLHRRLAADLGLGGRVEFTGWVDDPWPYLRQADVFVLPSLQEGSGSIALLEAMQAGAAVVASNVDGIPEDIRHGEDGLLVPPADPVALSGTLAGLIADEGLRRRLARGARAAYRSRFSSGPFSAALGEQYEAALDRG